MTPASGCGESSPPAGRPPRRGGPYLHPRRSPWRHPRGCGRHSVKLISRKLARYHGDHTGAVFFRWADTPGLIQPSGDGISAFSPRIVCPLLVIQGVADEYATEAQVTGIASQVSGPVETLMVPGCTHPHLQAGEVVLSHMARFVARSSRFPAGGLGHPPAGARPVNRGCREARGLAIWPVLPDGASP